MSDVLEKPEAQFIQPSSGQDSERLALAAAEAIRQLVVDRSTLRKTAAAQERELARLRANNAELWRHVALIRDSYRRLVTEFVAQLHSIDSAVGAAMPPEFRPGSIQKEPVYTPPEANSEESV
jgi:uncharacterized coiled-coil protein SlyX